VWSKKKLRLDGVSPTHFVAMNEFGKILVIGGLLIAIVGALLWSGIGKGWFARLPGDIHYTGKNFNFHFPVVTCLLISVVLTILLRLFRK
jgi:hypothetical protein